IRMLGALEASHLARRYVDEQGIDAHEEAIALYQRASREVRQRELKAYVERQLPVLRHHLEAARGVKAYLAGAARASAPSAPPPPSTPRPRVLIAPNSYRQRGCEDAVVEAEAELLRSRGHAVRL
ncbi:DUF4142 domain-containing protein, partial [Escherichia coli]|nr:DUF4142 domain-containing protein [Escherichia coli]